MPVKIVHKTAVRKFTGKKKMTIAQGLTHKKNQRVVRQPARHIAAASVEIYNTRSKKRGAETACDRRDSHHHFSTACTEGLAMAFTSRGNLGCAAEMMQPCLRGPPKTLFANKKRCADRHTPLRFFRCFVPRRQTKARISDPSNNYLLWWVALGASQG